MVATDRRGYVTITKDGIEAQVMPESLRVYTERGWDVVEPEGDTKTKKAVKPDTAEKKG